VSLDEATLAAEPTALTEKADEFGRDLNRVFASGAQAIAIDLLLPERWSHSATFSDLVLQHPGSLTLAALSTSSGTMIGPEAVAGLTASALGPKQASELFGLVNLEEDSDGVVRRGRLGYPDIGGGIRQTLAARAARNLVPTRVATDDSFWVDYSTDADRFQRLSWKDLSWKLDQEPSLFRGHLVLVGAEFEGDGDQAHAVPVRRGEAGETSGLGLQALLVNTLLRGMPFREVPHPPLLVATGIVAGLIVFGVLSLPSPSSPLILGAALMVLLIALSRLLFHSSWILPVAGPVTTVLIAVLAALILRRVLPALPRRERRTT
jgi:CHASE2 domain-containing sensor protein